MCERHAMVCQRLLTEVQTHSAQGVYPAAVLDEIAALAVTLTPLMVLPTCPALPGMTKVSRGHGSAMILAGLGY